MRFASFQHDFPDTSTAYIPEQNQLQCGSTITTIYTPITGTDLSF